MSNLLEKIVEQTREDLHRRRRKISASDLRSFPDYEHRRKNMELVLNRPDEISVIAEIKKASPSKGVIRKSFDPANIARKYEKAGAAALSVLTDEPFFQGRLDYLREVSRISGIPVLRKDFIVDFYQIEEARAYGADAILLIVKITDGPQLHELHHAAIECGLQVLVECYDEADWERMDFESMSLAGVNNRNLETFEVDVHRGISLLRSAPDHVVRISESGLSTASDLALLARNGIHSALIGEFFMRAHDPGEALRHLLQEALKYNEKHDEGRGARQQTV